MAVTEMQRLRARVAFLERSSRPRPDHTWVTQLAHATACKFSINLESHELMAHAALAFVSQDQREELEKAFSHPTRLLRPTEALAVAQQALERGLDVIYRW